jgi:nucleoside-diphosphate-sugar epimerase
VKTIAITGGAGFIGTHLTDLLIKNDYNVKVIDNLSEGSLAHLNPKALFFKSDIRDLDRLKEITSGCDVIVHLAAVRSVARSLENPLETNDVNISGTLKVLEAARLNGVKKVIYASSSSIYGGADLVPTPETYPMNPKSPYAVTKAAGELYLEVYAKLHQICGVSVRFFNIYGPLQNPNSPYAAVIPIFINAALKDAALIIDGDGTQSRDFTYIKDAVQALLKAVETDLTPGKNHPFNVASAKPYSILDLVQFIKEIVGKDLTTVFGPARVGDVPRSHADITKARRELNYEPSYNFSDGLKLTLDWLKDKLYRHN